MIAELTGVVWLLVRQLVNQLPGSVFYILPASLRGRCLQEDYFTDEQVAGQGWLSWDHRVTAYRCHSVTAMPLSSTAEAFYFICSSGMGWMGASGGAGLSYEPLSKNQSF